MYNRLLLLFDKVFGDEYLYSSNISKPIKNSEMVSIMQNIIEHLENQKLKSMISLFFLEFDSDYEIMKKLNISDKTLEIFRDYVIFELQILTIPCVTYIWK